MHLCNKNMNAMLVLKFSKHNTYNFQKVFDFSEFSRFEKSRDVTPVTSKVISPLSPGVDGLRLHLNQPESKKNINITHHSPPRNENLRNQL